MPVDTRTNWDERYATPDFLYGTNPNQYLRGQLFRLAPGSKVLVAADGEGRNGVWLAQQGHTVTSVDQSAVAQKKAIDLARDREVSVEFVCADLSRWSPPSVSQYDAAIAIFAHFSAASRPGIHAALARAIRPGGLVILEAFHVKQLGRQSGGPKDRDMLYEPAVLQRDFASLTTLELTEGIVLLDEGAKHQGEGYVVRFVGRRD
jgi:SAM-dependent methyltransferase